MSEGEQQAEVAWRKAMLDLVAQQKRLLESSVEERDVPPHLVGR